MSTSRELDAGELELVSGGGSQTIFSGVNLGVNPSHNYGLISDTFGKGMTFDQANNLVQTFNAPTRDALYGAGNDPNASFGQISRPGAQDLISSSSPVPLDWGGNVTLQHFDGSALNTTIDGQHPLEGTISRNLVVDLNDGGGYQVLTLGQGHDGAQLATAGGSIVGGELGGPIGSLIGGAGAQNGVHLVNPELGAIAFGQLDNSLIAHANDTHNPNLDLPSGRLVEAGNMLSATDAGLHSALGDGQPTHTGNVQSDTLNQLAHDLNQDGPVTGYFMLSSNGNGVYHVDQTGTHYYEMDNTGHVVETQVDPFGGVDAAVAHQAELNAQNPAPTPTGDIHLPDPPEQITGLPPELQAHDNGPASNTDHPDDHGAAPDNTGHINDNGNHAPDDSQHAGDGNNGSVQNAVHLDSDPSGTVQNAIHLDSDPPGTVQNAIHLDSDPPATVQNFQGDDSGNHAVDTAPAPIIPDIPAPIDIPAMPAPAPIDTSSSVGTTSGAYSDTNPVPVSEPVNPVDTSSDGGFGGGGDSFGGDESFGGGFDGGGDGGGGD